MVPLDSSPERRANTRIGMDTNPSAAFEERCRRLLGDLGLVRPGDAVTVRPLAGGVASDIAAVDVAGRRVCVKFALERLKVREEWRAPVHRNRAEYEWLRFAGRVAPSCVPELYGRSERENGFAMEFLDGPGIVLWKARLLDGHPDQGEASAVGEVLGRIHAASTATDFDASPFHNRDDFRALRLEPYLLFTATRHPALGERLAGLAEALYSAELALVHGDVSPKNILLRKGSPILLDAECAGMGDPCFDVAFCLNHLVLKAVHLPATRASLLGAARAFWTSYAAHVSWEEPKQLDARAAALLPALMLARVDGKSLVEYLDPDEQDIVRRLAVPLIAEPALSLDALLTRLRAGLEP